MVNEFISAILQILFLTSIPFIVYVIKKKTTKNFLNHIGLKKSTKRANLSALLVMILLVAPLLILVFTNEEFKAIMTSPESVTGKIKQMEIGVEAIITILIAAILKTSLSEEIFFRGFLAKLLIAVTNFQIGNVLQAIIFGMIHTLLFMTITENILFLIVIFVFPSIGAYYKTYINEKLGNGSIIPSWIAHGTANLVSYSVIVFVV